MFAGSWDPSGPWGRYGGRLYSTAISTLTLEVYYRLLPLYLCMLLAAYSHANVGDSEPPLPRAIEPSRDASQPLKLTSPRLIR